jgi:hypothetical protein
MTRQYRHTRIKIRAAEDMKGYQRLYYALRKKKHRSKKVEK